MTSVNPAASLMVAMAATLLLTVSDEASSTTVYRCNGAKGVIFSGTDCGADAQRVELSDRKLGGTLDGNLSGRNDDDATVPLNSRKSKLPAEAPSACRDFQSTDLRTYLIRDEVVAGMTREQVREAWGPPSEAYADAIEMWTYETKYYGRLTSITRVYFEEGCVSEVKRVNP